MWACICLSQLLLSALNEQCQVSTVGIFQGQLSSVSHELLSLSKLCACSVCATSDVVLLPSTLFAVTMTNLISSNDGVCVTIHGSLLGNFLFVFDLFSGKVRSQGSNTDQEGFSVLLKDT